MKITLQDSVAVRTPNWLGDAVIAMPAVRNLKRFLGDRPLTVVTPQKLEGLWKECPFVDRVVALHHPKKVFSSAQQIRAAGIQSILLFPGSLRVGSEALIARVSQRIGKRGHSRRFLLTHLLAPVVFDGENIHQKYDYLDMVHQITGIADDSLPEIRKESPSVRRNEIAIFPGAEYGPAKRWIADRFVQTALELRKQTGAEIRFYGAGKDRAICEELASQVEGSQTEAGKTSLEELIERIRTARLVVGNDSGAMHLAALLRTPAVAIFGSTEPKLTGPMSDQVTVIREHVVCSPCFLRKCPLDFACMKKISVDQVVQASLLRYRSSF